MSKYENLINKEYLQEYNKALKSYLEANYKGGDTGGKNIPQEIYAIGKDDQDDWVIASDSPTKLEDLEANELVLFGGIDEEVTEESKTKSFSDRESEIFESFSSYSDDPYPIIEGLAVYLGKNTKGGAVLRVQAVSMQTIQKEFDSLYTHIGNHLERKVSQIFLDYLQNNNFYVKWLFFSTPMEYEGVPGGFTEITTSELTELLQSYYFKASTIYFDVNMSLDRSPYYKVPKSYFPTAELNDFIFFNHKDRGYDVYYVVGEDNDNIILTSGSISSPLLHLRCIYDFGGFLTLEDLRKLNQPHKIDGVIPVLSGINAESPKYLVDFFIATKNTMATFEVLESSANTSGSQGTQGEGSSFQIMTDSEITDMNAYLANDFENKYLNV